LVCVNAAIKQPFPNCFWSQLFISYCTNILVLTFSYALIHSTSLYVFLSRVTCLVSGVHHFKVICLLLLCHVIWMCSLSPGCCVLPFPSVLLMLRKNPKKISYSCIKINCNFTVIFAGKNSWGISKYRYKRKVWVDKVNV